MQRADVIQQPQSQSFQSQPGKLQAGQIILGKINKIFPNQTAEVQIGNQKIIAALDAPLKTGERYWLQVQPGEGRLYLKMLNAVAGSESSSLKGTAEQLLGHLSLPQGRESMELAKFLLKNQLPVTKETFERSLKWLKIADGLTGGLAGIKTMHVLKLPFTDDIFQALRSLDSTETLSSDLTKLQEQMKGHGNATEVLGKVKALLENIAGPERNKIPSNALNKLLLSWLSAETPQGKQNSAYKVLQIAGFIPENMDETEFTKNIFIASQSDKNQFPAILKNGLSLILKYASAKQTGSPGAEPLLNVFNRLVSNPGKISAEQIQSAMVSTDSRWSDTDNLPEGLAKSSLFRGSEVILLTKKLLQSLLFHSGEKGTVAQKPINSDILFSVVGGSKYTPQQAGGRFAEMIAGELEADQRSSQLEGTERQLMKEIIASEKAPVDFTKGVSVAGFVKDIVKTLGLNMEHFLANVGGLDAGAPSEELLTLKPLLLKLLAENQHQSIKDAAEQVINRITAQQVLSQENGPLQNIFMQIPLTLSHFQTDMTLQWSGRKKSDGTIDPNYCRVLFYLDLEQMQQTVIDMQIQNRVMKITVVNENHQKLEQLARPLTDTLKNSIGNMNYKLTSLVFESEASTALKQPHTGASQSQALSASSKPYSGVDIRI